MAGTWPRIKNSLISNQFGKPLSAPSAFGAHLTASWFSNVRKEVNACDFSRDSRWLYISGGSELHAWDLATGKEVPTFTDASSGGGSGL